MVQRVIQAETDGRGTWTAEAKQQVAWRMQRRGRAFLASAILLRRQDGDEFVVLHLLCQGVEVLGKGYLISMDYDRHYPRLRRYGHDLVRLLQEIEAASGLTLLKGGVATELRRLNGFYRGHYLRYGSPLDFFIEPEELGSMATFRRLAAVLRYMDGTRSDIAICRL